MAMVSVRLGRNEHLRELARRSVVVYFCMPIATATVDKWESLGGMVP